MKKILVSICALGLLTACYEDKGNYDYTFDTMNEIKDFSFVPEATKSLYGTIVELQQPLTEEESMGRIEVNLEQTLEKNLDNIDFTWIVSHPEKDENNKPITVKDTLHTKGFLDLKLKVGEETNYSVLLETKDNTTSLSKFISFKVKTRPIFKNSLFVLHGKLGDSKLGNVEFYGSSPKVCMDAYKVVKPNEKNPFQNACCLAYAAFMNMDFSQRPFKTEERQRLAVFNMTGAAWLYNPYGLEQLYDAYYVLPHLGEGQRPLVIKSFVTAGSAADGNTDYKFVISRDGRFLWSRTQLAFRFPGTNCEWDPNHLTDYQAEAGVKTEQYFVFWDSKYNRFICNSQEGSYGGYGSEEEARGEWNTINSPVLDAHVDFSELEAQGISPKGKKALYAFINYKTNFSSATANFIFKDEQTGKHYLYKLTCLASGKDKKTRGKDEGGNNPMFSIKGQELPDFNPNNEKAIMYSTWFTQNYLFYAEGNTLYRYNTNNGDKVIMYEAPEGYDIVTLKLRSYDISSFSGDLGRYIILGMNKGNEGAVTELKLQTSSDVDPEYSLPVITSDAEGNKFGNIIDVQFAHFYSYNVQ